jgi:hypothetical protein
VLSSIKLVSYLVGQTTDAFRNSSFLSLITLVFVISNTHVAYLTCLFLICASLPSSFHDLLQSSVRNDDLFSCQYIYIYIYIYTMATDPEARVRFPALSEKKSSGSGTGSTQPREYN